jgi:hypothetical protein
VSLRRTAVGSFRIEDADDGRLHPPSAAVSHLPNRGLDADEVELVRTGRAIPAVGIEGPAALLHADTLVAVGQADGVLIRPETVLL